MVDDLEGLKRKPGSCSGAGIDFARGSRLAGERWLTAGVAIISSSSVLQCCRRARRRDRTAEKVASHRRAMPPRDRTFQNRQPTRVATRFSIRWRGRCPSREFEVSPPSPSASIRAGIEAFAPAAQLDFCALHSYEHKQRQKLSVRSSRLGAKRQGGKPAIKKQRRIEAWRRKHNPFSPTVRRLQRHSSAPALFAAEATRDRTPGLWNP